MREESPRPDMTARFMPTSLRRAQSAVWRKLCIRIYRGDRRNALSARTGRAFVRCRRASAEFRRAVVRRPELIFEIPLAPEVCKKNWRYASGTWQSPPRSTSATSWLHRIGNGEPGLIGPKCALHLQYAVYRYAFVVEVAKAAVPDAALRRPVRSGNVAVDLN